MQQSGGTVSKVDPAVFYWLDESCHVMGVLACHVDDFTWGGSETVSMTVISHLKAAFQVGCETQQLQLHWNRGTLCRGRNTGAAMDVHNKSPAYTCGPH